MSKYFSLLFYGILILTSVQNVFAEAKACQQVLAKHIWSGPAQEGGLNVKINALFFNKNLNQMTINDDQDPTPLSIPVTVTCSSNHRVTITYSSSQQLEPNILYLNGEMHMASSSYTLKMNGEKKVYQKDRKVKVSFKLHSDAGDA